MLLHSLCLAEGAQVSILRDAQLAICSLYSLPALARESLPMGNRSFLPQFLGVPPPRETGAPWALPPCSTTHRGRLGPLWLPQRGGEKGKIPKEVVHLPEVRADF